MNVLIIFAHPEPNSLNGVMKDITAKTLRDNGHEVKISDLYGMRFKAVLDENDFSQRQNTEQFNPMMEQVNAVGTGSLSQDIKDEVKKIKWADMIIFQFPVWWTSPPAILKGWFDRVFLPGVVHNIAEGKMYDTGLLRGKKAMLSFTTGAPKEVYSSEGPHGDLNDIFKFITHNILEVTGLEVLPSIGIYGPAMVSKEHVKKELEKFKERINSL
ncbi:MULTISPECIES: NAD(P)H-dependent oxidoreductase [Methanobacterium]|jgi:NAD(P)H dehydrogenase (quinone)|uniref:NAD(P)H-dependent oxidoreductase n=1 Tax=Methanobacterium veterum TaxID=408577 RepID=A0A9E5A5M5_9EURY|nr:MULTISPECIES: NAD(P)H-dependent oxidoreductase [Methanobacterium]MCZ3367316.1 NAD(P)H-dependent oxidoreductase [Methanobacterium veterum]MCZ3373536.1 NAD(P)H-dependent oxidoreductase [Methanobacterium veterum]